MDYPLPVSCGTAPLNFARTFQLPNDYLQLFALVGVTLMLLFNYVPMFVLIISFISLFTRPKTFIA